MTGMKVAATTSATSTDAVTVPSRTASQRVTAARLVMARSRQLIAPVRRTQRGTTAAAGSDEVTMRLSRY
jgi:hypothetical protein